MVLDKSDTVTDILISEVGPRDGLQNVDSLMPLEARCRWVSAEAAAGVREIEVGSFVSPKRVPQMAGTEDVVAHALSIPGLCVAVLVPNLKGAQRAIDAGAHKISIPVSVSETHSLKNVNRSHDQMVEEVKAIRALVDAQPSDRRPHFEAGLSTAFGCTLAGPVTEDSVVRLAERLIGAGAAEVGLSDTTGMANPAHVKNLVRKVRAAIGPERLTGVHLHNTRGLGLANALAALALPRLTARSLA